MAWRIPSLPNLASVVFNTPPQDGYAKRRAHGDAGAAAAAATTPAEAAWMRSAAAPALPLMGSEAAGRLRSVPAGAAIARHPRTGFRT